MFVKYQTTSALNSLRTNYNFHFDLSHVTSTLKMSRSSKLVWVGKDRQRLSPAKFHRSCFETGQINSEKVSCSKWTDVSSASQTLIITQTCVFYLSQKMKKKQFKKKQCLKSCNGNQRKKAPQLKNVGILKCKHCTKNKQNLGTAWDSLKFEKERIMNTGEQSSFVPHGSIQVKRWKYFYGISPSLIVVEMWWRFLCSNKCAQQRSQMSIQLIHIHVAVVPNSSQYVLNRHNTCVHIQCALHTNRLPYL